MCGRFVTAVLCVAAVLSLRDYGSAAGGTSTVATKGRPAYVSPGWPEGVGKLVNDSSRTSGWNSWFTEWPNDVNHYAFEIMSSDDVNRLIAKLDATKTDLRQIRLSYLKEPKGLGWVTQLQEGNAIPVVFSIGDQSRIDEWFKRVRKPFGLLEFTAAPEAVPPTLTIFVQNQHVKLGELEIPDGIEVSAGYVPTSFHIWNTTIEKKLKEEPTKPETERALKAIKQKLDEKLDKPSLAALDSIEQFLNSHKGRTKR